MDIETFRLAMMRLMGKHGKDKVSPTFCNTVWKMYHKKLTNEELQKRVSHLMIHKSIGDEFRPSEFDPDYERPKPQLEVIPEHPKPQGGLKKVLNEMGHDSVSEAIEARRKMIRTGKKNVY